MLHLLIISIFHPSTEDLFAEQWIEPNPYIAYTTTGGHGTTSSSSNANSATTTAFSSKSTMPTLQEFEDGELDDMFDDMMCANMKPYYKYLDKPPPSLGAKASAAIAAAGAAVAANRIVHAAASSLAAAAVAGGGGRQPSAARGPPFIYRCISAAQDHRLGIGINARVETELRRLSLHTSMDVFSAFSAKGSAGIPAAAAASGCAAAPAPWPTAVLRCWPDADYPMATGAIDMLTAIFDEIFAALPMQFTWMNVEQLLQLWLTLNGELADRGAAGRADKTGHSDGFDSPLSTSSSSSSSAATASDAAFTCNLIEAPKIPFGRAAIDGLLELLCSQQANSLRTWFLSFQCLMIACNPTAVDRRHGGRAEFGRMARYIVDHAAFERMLVRFYTSTEARLTGAENRSAGPTICRLVHELFGWLQAKPAREDAAHVRRRLHEILMAVVLRLVQPGGAIAIQTGPTDAQVLLIRELIEAKCRLDGDMAAAMAIVESVAVLLQLHNSHTEKVTCIRTPDNTNGHHQPVSSNAFGHLFASVLGDQRHQQVPPNQLLLVSLLKLCARLIRGDAPIVAAKPQQSTTSSTTDETKASLQNQQQQQQTFDNAVGDDDEYMGEEEQNGAQLLPPPLPARTEPLESTVANNVLRHQPTMQRLMMALAQASSSTFAQLMSTFQATALSDMDDCLLHAMQDAEDVMAEAERKNNARSTSPWSRVQPAPVAPMAAPTITVAAAAAAAAGAEGTNLVADAVYEVLTLLGKQSTSPTLIVEPLCEFFKSSECANDIGSVAKQTTSCLIYWIFTFYMVFTLH